MYVLHSYVFGFISLSYFFFFLGNERFRSQFLSIKHKS